MRQGNIMTSLYMIVVGDTHLFNLFLPLIQHGRIKKVVSVSSGMPDLDFVVDHEIDSAAPYAISKPGTHMAIANIHAQYKNDGIFFMSVWPGYVDAVFHKNGMYLRKDLRG